MIGENVIFKGEIIFDFRGGGSGEIYVENGCELHNVTMATNGKKSKIRIRESSKWKGFLLSHGENAQIDIGKKSTSIDSFILARDANVTIGERCLFSRDVEIRSSDSHKIYSKGTKERLNLPSDVKVGDHVWIAANSIISKGAEVPSESVVGAMSFVNKKFTDENVILVGAPAKVVKKDIEWER